MSGSGGVRETERKREREREKEKKRESDECTLSSSENRSCCRLAVVKDVCDRQWHERNVSVEALFSQIVGTASVISCHPQEVSIHLGPISPSGRAVDGASPFLPYSLPPSFPQAAGKWWWLWKYEQIYCTYFSRTWRFGSCEIAFQLITCFYLVSLSSLKNVALRVAFSAGDVPVVSSDLSGHFAPSFFWSPCHLWLA